MVTYYSCFDKHYSEDTDTLENTEKTYATNAHVARIMQYGLLPLGQNFQVLPLTLSILGADSHFFKKQKEEKLRKWNVGIMIFQK